MRRSPSAPPPSPGVWGRSPRVAFITYTTFGNPPGRHIEGLREAVKLLDSLQTDLRI